MADANRARRRAAFRSAYHAARSSPEQSPEAWRRIYAAELARWGVSSLTPEQIDEAVAAARHPIRGIARLLSLATRAAGDFATGVRAARNQVWMTSPADAEGFDWPDDTTSYFAPVRLLPDSGPLIERMLSTCQLVDLPELAHLSEPVRLLELWLDLLPPAEPHSLTPVHIGPSTIGTIDDRAQRIVANMFATMSAPRLSIEGYLIGADATVARVVAELPAAV